MSKFKSIIVILLSIAILGVSCEDDWGKNSREFWEAYFSVIKGKEFKLNKDCFSGEYNQLFGELNKQFLIRNYFGMLMTIKTIITLEIEKCPYNDELLIISDANTALHNGTFFKNLMKNKSKLTEVIKNFLHSDQRSEELGKVIGELTKILIYGVSF
jgi:hypothetical protein